MVQIIFLRSGSKTHSAANINMNKPFYHKVRKFSSAKIKQPLSIFSKDQAFMSRELSMLHPFQFQHNAINVPHY